MRLRPVRGLHPIFFYAMKCSRHDRWDVNRDRDLEWMNRLDAKIWVDLFALFGMGKVSSGALHLQCKLAHV